MRFTQLNVDIPSVVPVVTSAAGKPVLDVEVQVDGQRLASSLDGHSFIMNPGAHDFSFSKDGHIFATQSVLIVQGQRNRLIAASLASPSSPPAEEAPRARKSKRMEAQAGPPIASNAESESESKEKAEAPPRAAVDLISRQPREGDAVRRPRAPIWPRARNRRPRAVSRHSASCRPASAWPRSGAGALFTYWGRKDNTLLDSCSPGCRQSSADHIHNLYLAADISFGVGLAALAGSYWAYAHSKSNREEGGEEVAVRTTPRILVAPTPSGAIGALSGSF